MAPPKATKTLTSVLKKQRIQTVTTPVTEENLGASSSEPIFPRDYTPLRKDTTKPVNLQKDVKYPLMEPNIPHGVIVEGDMLGMIPQLKYVDHDITDKKKFSELALHKYFKSYINTITKLGCDRTKGMGNKIT
jgi:hypothetical protein